MKRRFFVIVLACVLAMGVLTACGVSFKVNFLVDGALYASVKTGGSEVIELPQNPTKEGYTFGGWFWDENTWEVPFTANSLLDAPLSSDMNVYCKWNPNLVRVESVILNETELSLRVDEEKTLAATVLPSNATDKTVAWQSSNTFVATVSDGRITALNVGTTTITATTNDGDKTCECKVNVVEDKIIFKTLTVDGEAVYGVVPNATETFSFLNEIEEQGNAEYKVYKEISCETQFAAKTIRLKEGDNTVYVLQTAGKRMKLYTVTIRRRPLYTVVFDVDGGSSVASQTVEEGDFALKPSTTRIGYEFGGWNYDFTKPITGNTTIKARWFPMFRFEGGTIIAVNNYFGINEHFIIPSSIDGEKVTSIGDRAFYYMPGEITSISIPDSVISIGEDAFGGCYALTSIYISDIAAWCNITGLQNLMRCGSSDKKLYLNNEPITNLVIPDSVTSIGDYAFA